MPSFLRFLFIVLFPRLHAAQEKITSLERQLKAVSDERDDYRSRYVDKCEYVAITEGKPRFSITQPREQTPIVNERVSRLQLEEEKAQKNKDSFLAYLSDHPEEREFLAPS